MKLKHLATLLAVLGALSVGACKSKQSAPTNVDLTPGYAAPVK